MSRFGKITVSAALLAPLVLGGCRPSKGTANPEDYFPLIQVAMAGGETGAMIGRNEAIKAKNFAGCVASEALISAFDSANEVLTGRLNDQIVIPAVEVDVSECMALRDAPAEESEDGREDEAAVTHLGVAVAGYAPAEEEAPVEGPAAEETPAEEEAAEEPAAEEAPAEEPAEEAAEEEPAEEEAPAVEASLELSSSDAAVLVESIAGITVAAVLHYAVKLKGANCKKGTAALGAINYVNGMIKPVADEIANPDGKISVPAVTIDLSECSDS